MITTNSTGSTSNNKDPLNLIRKSSKQQQRNSNNRIIKSSAQDALALAEWNARKW